MPFSGKYFGNFSDSSKKNRGHKVVTINVYINLERTGISLMLPCLTQEGGMSSYLFVSICVSQSALKLSSYLFCTFLCIHLVKPQQDGEKPMVMLTVLTLNYYRPQAVSSCSLVGNTALSFSLQFPRQLITPSPPTPHSADGLVFYLIQKTNQNGTKNQKRTSGVFP